MNILEELNSQPENKKRFNNFFLGLIVSIILPIISVLLISAGGDSASQTFEEHLEGIFDNTMFVNFGILALMPNMIIFFFLYKTERWQSAYGLIVATILFMILIIWKM